ncbi:MAG: hypothetical protein WBC73_02245 [Phormidesmis sp.]
MTIDSSSEPPKEPFNGPPLNGPPKSNRPVAVGDVLATGWRLYRSHFSQYAAIALKANLWMFVPLMLISLIGALFAQGAESVSAYRGVLALLVPSAVVLFILSFAQFLGLTAGISRLAYQTLSEGHETAPDTLRFTLSRKYSLLWQNVLRGLIFMAVYILLLFFAVVFIVVVIGEAETSSTLPTVVALLAVGGMIASIFCFIWLALRMMLADQPLAIEPESSATKAIGRSWRLTKGSVMRSLLVAITVYFIAVPITFILYVASQIIVYRLFSLSSVPAPGTAPLALADMVPVLAGAGISVLGSLAGSVITTPLWHTMLTALYFNLRNRQSAQPTPRQLS